MCFYYVWLNTFSYHNFNLIIKKIFILAKNLDFFNEKIENWSVRCENLTFIKGIEAKNFTYFYADRSMTPESIFSESDEELVSIQGVDISLVKMLIRV